MMHVKGGRGVRARVCKLAFESLYGPFAWAYDWVSNTFFMGQWEAWQRSAIAHLEGERVLELGMGTGNMQVALAGAGFEVWGVDLSAQMIRQATTKVRRSGLSVGRMVRASAGALPFPAGYFDSVVSTFPTEYITDPRTLGEVGRVLKAGGRLVVVPGGWLKPKGTHARALDGVARIVYGKESGASGGGMEELEHRLEQKGNRYGWVGVLKRRMEEAGFSVSARVASNSKGSCLIVIGHQTSTSNRRPVEEAASQSSLSGPARM
jgi:ubiquinone/menaquinone biosynthesis C-methylase UbiE